MQAGEACLLCAGYPAPSPGSPTGHPCYRPVTKILPSASLAPARAGQVPAVGDLSELLDRLEQRITEVDELDEPARRSVFDLLDGVDALHRTALRRLATIVGEDRLKRAAERDPAVEWLLSAYGVGVDERRAAEEALDAVRPFVHSHGGRVEVLEVTDGRVRLRMAGSCSGCTASAVTLRYGIEEALREHFPGFMSVEVEENIADEAHAPPGETFVELRRKSA